jgi:spore germination protein KA
LKGPAEAFVENFRTNTALIRKFVKDKNLVFESIKVGTEVPTRCAIAYISTITNENLINEVKRRISEIEIDYLLDSGQLEQLIEDKTYIVDPLMINTERPDKVASHLIEGRVAIIVEGSSNVLVVPAIFTDFTHPSEDSYLRFPYSLLIRIFRLPAIFFAVFLPGLYIAICNFHQEMIPTDLLFAIAGAREKVPFTMLTELLIMEIAFEIIREASIRTPAPVGPTLRNCRNNYFTDKL